MIFAVVAVCIIGTCAGVGVADRFGNVPTSVQKRASGQIKEWLGDLIDADFNRSDLDHLDQIINFYMSWIYMMISVAYDLYNHTLITLLKTSAT